MYRHIAQSHLTEISHEHTHTHTRTQACTYAHTHTHTHTHTRTHAHARAHTHMQTPGQEERQARPTRSESMHTIYKAATGVWSRE